MRSTDIVKLASAHILAAYGLDKLAKILTPFQFPMLPKPPRPTGVRPVWNASMAYTGASKNPTLALHGPTLLEHIRSLGDAVPASLRP